MRFRLQEGSQPCPGAQRVERMRVDHRVFKSAAEFDRRVGHMVGSWLSKGTNHRTTEHGIARDFPGELVTHLEVEFETLEELIRFVQANGKIVVAPPDAWSDGLPKIAFVRE